MYYEFLLKARTTNVKNIFIDQTLPVILRCTHCNETREKPVIITSESIKRNERNEKANAAIKCNGCKREYEINITANKKNKYIHWLDMMNTKSEEYYLSDIRPDGRFVASTLESRGCEIVEVNNLCLNVLSNDGSLFLNISLNEKMWKDFDKKKKIIEICDFEYSLEERKKK